MKELSDMSAVDLLACYRRKEISPVEAVDAVFDCIDRWDGFLNATYLQRRTEARAAAKASEARWLSAEPAGALDGVPITIKESLATKGDPSPFGTFATGQTPQPADAPPTARAIEAKAVIVTKTTMPDYGMLTSGLSTFHGTVRNPWNLAKTPGGSSSGAGAACAAGYGPLHVGTDIGGSVRLPAAWCGIFGLKPSLGRIPIDGPYIGRCVGPMTRTVDDAALLMSVLARPDARDHMSLPAMDIDWTMRERDVKGLRLGLLLDAGCGQKTDPQVRHAVEAAAKIFEGAGAVIEPVKPFVPQEMLDGFNGFFSMRVWADLLSRPDDKRQTVLPFIREWAAKTALKQSGLSLYESFNKLFSTRAAVNAACEPFDYLLAPVAATPAFSADLPCPTNDIASCCDHINFSLPFNLSEQPAASINCGYSTEELPIGLQIVGKRFDDAGVLSMSKVYESLRPVQKPWPNPPRLG